MSITEIVVTLGGLYFGYWVVLKVFASKDRPAANSRDDLSGEKRQSEKTQPLWHEILNVPSTASTGEIRQSYRTLVSQYHPDKVATLGDELKTVAERKSKEINLAYEKPCGNAEKPPEIACCVVWQGQLKNRLVGVRV
ncbi:MAG: J domain-containing protein [Betaproteobacteria bacterium]